MDLAPFFSQIFEAFEGAKSTREPESGQNWRFSNKNDNHKMIKTVQ